MKRLLLILFTLTLAFNIFGQSPYFIIDGNVTDIEGNLPIKSATVVLRDQNVIEHYTKTDTNGYYQFDSSIVKPNTKYEINVTANGYLKVRGLESTIQIFHPTRFKHDFKMQRTCSPRKMIKIPFESIHFKNDSVIQMMVDIMMDNPHIVIELIEVRSLNDKSNKLNYARKLLKWLIEAGVKKDRLFVALKHSDTEPNQKKDLDIDYLTLKVLRDDYE